MREMRDWQPIESAPKDGTTIKTCRVIDGEVLFERDAAWREVTFAAYGDAGISVPQETAVGWMYPDIDKRVPEPTHWLPSGDTL